MYEQFYGLKERPFSLNPNPFFLYKSKKHQRALNLMEYGLINQAAFCVITGEIGTGKTTLVRKLLHQIDKKFSIGLLTSTHHSFGELLKLLLIAFDLDHRNKDKAELYQTLYDFLIEEYSHQRQVVLIIDEAQNMAPDTLEELRMLSNINVDEHNVLQMILVGQEGLRKLLRRPELEQFAQRIAVDYHLEPLDRVETHKYILHRLEIAGGPKSRHIFNMEACDAVYQYTGGIPRLINMLCDVALVYGFAEQKRALTAELIDEVAMDKKGGGILPLREITGPFDASESHRLISVHAPIEEKTEDDSNQVVNNNEVKDSTESVAKEPKPPQSSSSPIFTSQAFDKIYDEIKQEEERNCRPSLIQNQRRGFTKLSPGLTVKIARTYLETIRNKSQPIFQKLHMSLCDLLKKGKEESLRLIKLLNDYTQDQYLVKRIQVRVLNKFNSNENNHPQNSRRKRDHWRSSLTPSLIVNRKKVAIAVTALAIIGLLIFLSKIDLFHGHDAANVLAQDAEAMTKTLPTRNSSLLNAHRGELQEPVDGISHPRLASVSGEKTAQVAKSHVSAQNEALVVVEAGSTLSKILVEKLGRYDENLLDEVLRLNPKISNPDIIAVGQKITLPKMHQIN